MSSIFNALFTSNALADAQEMMDSMQGNPIMNFVPFIVVLGVFYFFMIKPQQKKQKEFQDMLSAVKVGDKVSTTGGLIGMISDIDNDKGTVVLSLNKGVEVLLYKRAVLEVIAEEKKESKSANAAAKKIEATTSTTTSAVTEAKEAVEVKDVAKEEVKA